MASHWNGKQSDLIEEDSWYLLDTVGLIHNSELEFIIDLACKSFPVQSASVALFKNGRMHVLGDHKTGYHNICFADLLSGSDEIDDGILLSYKPAVGNGMVLPSYQSLSSFDFYTSLPIQNQDNKWIGLFSLVSYEAFHLQKKEVQLFKLLVQRTEAIITSYLVSDPNAASSMPLVAANMGRDNIDFASLIQNIPFPVAIFDLDIRMLAASNSWLEAGQIQKQKWRGEQFKDIYQDTEAWEEKHLIAQKGTELCGKEDLVINPYYDSPQYINWKIRPWYKTNGSIGGTVMSIQNVTESVLTKFSLQKALEYEEEAKKTKAEFLSNISHELRTPLNGILGFTGLAIEADVDDVRLKYLEIARISATKLLNIVNNVLDFSQLESGSICLELRKVPLCDIVRQVVDVTAQAIFQKGLEMLVRFRDQHPISIHTDPVRLKQILLILLENATKFTHQGEIELHLETLHLDKVHGRACIRFRVRDTGIGIDSAHVEKIKQAFTQIEPPATKNYEGAGMGLAIACNLLKIMDSKLELISTPGVGSEFFFDLNVGIQMTEVNAPIHLNFIKKVLIVDENASVRRNIDEILTTYGIACEQVNETQETIRLMQSGAQYDVVIAQHNPSDISDVDLATALKTGTTQPLPEIILLHNRIDDLEILKRAGALPIKSILQKPVRYQDLIIALSDLYANITEKNVSNGIPKKADLNSTRELSILMVEDNLVNMILLKKILQRILPTARLIEAGNGLVAVNICEQELPDIIFMDVQMPVMDGLEATKTIRSIKGAESLPIIALTAGNEKGAMQECLNAGMSHFLTKPYTPKDLEKVLEEFELV